LNVLPLELPPLRKRPDDIPLIASHLLAKHCAKLDRPLKRPTPQLLELFLKNRWKGNVRELENSIIQGIMFSTGEAISPEDAGLTDAVAKRKVPAGDGLSGLPYKEAKDRTLHGFNHTFIGNLLKGNKGNVTRAAKACGLERQALQQIMRRYGINAEKYRV